MIRDYVASDISTVFYDVTDKFMARKATGQAPGLLVAYGFFRNVNYLSTETLKNALMEGFKKAQWKVSDGENNFDFIIEKAGSKTRIGVSVNDRSLDPDEIRLHLKKV